MASFAFSGSDATGNVVSPFTGQATLVVVELCRNRFLPETPGATGCGNFLKGRG